MDYEKAISLEIKGQTHCSECHLCSRQKYPPEKGRTCSYCKIVYVSLSIITAPTTEFEKWGWHTLSPQDLVIPQKQNKKKNTFSHYPSPRECQGQMMSLIFQTLFQNIVKIQIFFAIFGFSMKNTFK